MGCVNSIDVRTYLETQIIEHFGLAIHVETVVLMSRNE